MVAKSMIDLLDQRIVIFLCIKILLLPGMIILIKAISNGNL
jgi:hypothetical protein